VILNTYCFCYFLCGFSAFGVCMAVTMYSVFRGDIEILTVCVAYFMAKWWSGLVLSVECELVGNSMMCVLPFIKEPLPDLYIYIYMKGNNL
jgi:hypothetical protein